MAKLTVSVCDADYKATQVTFEGAPVPELLRRWKEPETLTDETLVCQGEHHDRGYRNQISGWYRVFPSGRRLYIMQERSCFPYNWYKEPTHHYWLTQTHFAEPVLAAGYLAGVKAKPECWNIQHSFYGPGYFLISSDFDEALKFLGYRYGSVAKNSA